jgi:neutral ceramidase
MDRRRHGVLDEIYIDKTLDTLADTAVRALENRAPARIRAGTGWCGISASRRKPDGRRGFLFKPSLEAPHDHQVSVLAFESNSGQLRHVLFSYACHPTSTGAINEIGGDYPGFPCAALERRYGGVTAAFFQGCAGDQKVDARDAQEDGFRKLSINEVCNRGEMLGEAVARVLEADDLRDLTGPLVLDQEFVALKTDVATEGQLAAALEAPEEYVRQWARQQMDLHTTNTPQRSTFDFEVQTLRCRSDLALIALAGEMSVEFGLRFRREFGAMFRDVWTLGYANDMVGYVPVRRQISEGGYAVIDNNRRLLYTGPFAADSEALIGAAVHRCLGGG